MEKAVIINLLTNSGLKVFGMDDNFVYFQDPSCLFPAFDSFLDFAWIVALIFIGIMLFGWAILYIKNGVNFNSLSNNIKSLLLILCVFSVTKPVVNTIYGDNLLSQQCETKKVSLSVINDLLESRKKRFGKSAELNFETFDVIDTGVAIAPESFDETSNN